ncbi:DUF3147 family protein [Lysinibacillus telephonicus]|uniref:DUF3147 family protein n=1 Tax=Lysinibacillus telephonicus TaxID=1714840 RepID=A0A431UQI3_9BACI|nr:DUF3147 family protein [Lysinibacillus telephonicus]RTQ92415.1 DUF3147 family protein [Lysinibacillus telephonicus]
MVWIKLFTSAVIIALVTEFAKKFPLYGGIIAALPLISLLSIFWLTIQGETIKQIQTFTMGVIIGLPATIIMLLVIYVMLKNSFSFLIAFLAGVASWGFLLAIQKLIFVKFNLHL